MYRLYFSLFAIGASARSILRKRDPASNVLGVNFPDPCIVDANGRTYIYATSNGEAQIPVRSTADFSDPSAWTTESIEVLPKDTIPAWAGASNNWAPDVSQLPDGSFILYYAPALANSSKHAIGVGKSSSPEGPFTISDTPFDSDPERGGYIDPDGFLDDDGRRYVVYKLDGNSIASGGCSANGPAPYADTPFYLQEVDANDGETKIGDKVEIFNNNGAEDDYNIEAPSIVKVDGIYFLFFSKGCYADSSYATLYATSTSLSGPYDQRGTLLKSGDFNQSGPGSPDLTPDGRIVYHSLIVPGQISKGRQVNTDTVTFNGRVATLN